MELFSSCQDKTKSLIQKIFFFTFYYIVYNVNPDNSLFHLYDNMINLLTEYINNILVIEMFYPLMLCYVDFVDC